MTKSDKQNTSPSSSLLICFMDFHDFQLRLAWSHGICGADRQHLITRQELGNGLVHKTSQNIVQSFNALIVKDIFFFRGMPYFAYLVDLIISIHFNIVSYHFLSSSFSIYILYILISCLTPFHHRASFCAVAWVRAFPAKSSAAAASLLEGGSTPERRNEKKSTPFSCHVSSSFLRFFHQRNENERRKHETKTTPRLCRPPPARVSRHFGAPGPTCYDLPAVVGILVLTPPP